MVVLTTVLRYRVHCDDDENVNNYDVTAADWISVARKPRVIWKGLNG